MWLNLLMDNCHFSDCKNKLKFLYLFILGKIKNLPFFKKRPILHNENNIVKDLMITFLNSHWIHKDCRSISTEKNFKNYLWNDILSVFLTFYILIYNIFFEHIIE